ncbi:hypothetical protein P5673_010739 [Acropora cervicornis]|uniref:Uncharacterized protein n=1 Tax=Acropora cervicornis TaxID=6130 RepID=A0AAD9QR54_ACRCE|nr:hypothetical protein P5673_010739 [Acropora cervicornis]
MYCAVTLAPEDREYHRFLWRDKPGNPITDYRMTRVTFGIASAAFLATNSVLHVAEENKLELPLSAKTEESPITRRSVLSDSAKIFDPFGFISCVTIVVKIILQKLWEQGTTWEEPRPPHNQRDWLDWRMQLSKICTLRIPRCYAPVNVQIVDRQLSSFSDASERAYCGVVYVRSINKAGGVHISLALDKTRVALLKKVTLSRLELCRAHLLVQLMKHLQGILSIPTCNLHAFTDSTFVLSWIHGSSQRFKTFEANRIGEIQENVPPEERNHIGRKENPANIGSLSILPGKVVHHKLWWNGPDWIKRDPSEWPSKFTRSPSLEALYSSGIKRETLLLKETKEEETKEVTLQAVTTEVKPVIDIQRYLSFIQLVTVITWVFCVVTHSHLFSSTPLSVNELFQAKVWLFKQAQGQTFSDTVEKVKKGNLLPLSNPLQPLHSFLDEDGLLRVGGRLSQSHKAYHSHHPRTCPKITTQLMGQLPAVRVLPTFSNERVSVDYSGPLTLKVGSTRRRTYLKAYAAVFVCLATESCHIELVSDLTAEAFLDKELKELSHFLKHETHKNQNKLLLQPKHSLEVHPPTGPHHRSVWENGVKACKHHLKRTVVERKLTFEEMMTVLCQIEACLNSRPLFTSLDANDDDG